MPEDLYPRPIYLSLFAAFQTSHPYVLGDVVRPAVSNDHVYVVTVAGTSGGTPSWPTTTQATTTTGGVTFTENGRSPGVQYLKYTKHARDWKEITIISTYEDKGVDTNESADDVPQRWTLEYDGLSEADIKLLDDFWDVHRLSQPFTFVEPRDRPWTGHGATVASVRFEDYEDRDHDKVWIQRRVAHLVKYPS